MFLLQFDGFIFKTRSSKYKETLTTYIMFDDYDRQTVTEIGNKKTVSQAIRKRHDS